MRYRRLRWGLVAGTVLVASLGLTAPGSAAPTSTPTFESPDPGSTVSGYIEVVVSSTAPWVQFFLDGMSYGPPQEVAAGNASAEWPTWLRPNGSYDWTAADCDDNLGDCNTTQSSPLQLTVANTPLTITAPENDSTVSGDVTVSVTTAAPMVKFAFDGTEDGVVAASGTASTVWSTSGLADGSHTVDASECDIHGINCGDPQTVMVTTVNSDPVITPLDGETVSGVVNVSAETAASQVQFSLDGDAVGGPVAVTDESATVTWTTWGLANGSHSWTAAAVCDNPGCSPPQTTVELTLENAAPAITSPANGAVTGSTVTIDATSPGGGLAFFLDGTQVAFDAAAPYSFTASTPLSLGDHAASVRQCDTSGAECSGPSSTISFTVGKLRPSITSVTPNPFSPGTKSTKDRTSFRVRLPEAQELTWRVQNQNGKTVDGPHPKGLQAAGTHTYRWDGRNNDGKIVPDGTYALVVNTATGTGATRLAGAHRASVRVDRSRTSFTAVTGVKSTVYPVRDGYLDAFRPNVHVSEGGRLRMVISTPRGKRLRTIARSHATKGTFRLSWNGRDSRNHLVPAGKYRFQFFAEDRAGNPSSSRRFGVRVSHRRTVHRIVTLHRRGDAGRVGTTNARCTQYSFGFSNFEHGLWLDNFCDRGFGDAAIYADYTFAVPRAVRYDGIRVRTVGASYAPGPISVQVYNFTDSKWEAAGRATLRTKSKTVTSTFRRVSGAHRVSLRRRVRIRVVVPNVRRQEDYDVDRAGVVVSYQVLRSNGR